MTLRPYQKDAMNSIETFIKSNGRYGFVVLPTGTGKSILIAETAKKFSRVLVLQPTSTILLQNYNKYISYGFEAAINSHSAGKREIGNVVFATPGSIKGLTQKFECIIIDECDQGTKRGTATEKLLKELNPDKIIGFTATPIINKTYRFGAVPASLIYDSLFENVIHVTQVSEVKEYWATINNLKSSVDESSLSTKTYLGEFTDESITQFYHSNNIESKAIKAINYLYDRNVMNSLIFMARVIDAEKLYNTLKSIGLKVGIVHGKLDNNVVTINNFMKGRLNYLINVGMLTVGFDFPPLQSIIDCSPTNSFRLYYQKVGRLVRPFGEITKYYLDLSGNINRFGKLSDIVIFNNSKSLNVYVGDNKITKNINWQYKPHPEMGVFGHGKHKDATFAEVFKKDPQYIFWVASKSFMPTNEHDILLKEKCKRIEDAFIK